LLKTATQFELIDETPSNVILFLMAGTLFITPAFANKAAKNLP
jgi:hypothetical protein